MRYAVSGANATILDATFDATAVDGIPVGSVGAPTVLMGGQNLLGENLPAGKVLYLRSVWAYDASAPILLHIFDASAGANATGSTRKMFVQCVSGSLVNVDIPAPGLKFSTGCVVCKDTTAASGSFVPGSVGGVGYYE